MPRVRVREVFERAYGPVPESATCHVGWQYDAVAFPKCDGEVELLPVKYSCERWGAWLCYGARSGAWNVTRSRNKPYRGDISECDAAAFSPVFQCAAYDAALEELKKEKVDSQISHTMRKYDPALHELAKPNDTPLKIRCDECGTFLIFTQDVFSPFGGAWVCTVCRKKHEKNNDKP